MDTTINGIVAVETTVEERLTAIEERIDTVVEILTELLEKVNNISTPGVDFGYEDE